MKNSISQVFDKNGFAIIVNMQPVLQIISLEPTSPVKNYERAVKETQALIDGSSQYKDAQDDFNAITKKISVADNHGRDMEKTCIAIVRYNLNFN